MRSKSLIYNEEQKQEYINFEKSNSLALTNYFKRLGDKEREYSKDIADMNVEELKDTLISLNVRREESRRHLISLLRGYINWTKLYNKTNNDNAINIISSESIFDKSVITSQMIKNPKHLEYILELGFEKKDEKYLMPNRTLRDKLVLWLVYNGMSIEELSLLKTTEIDKKIITTANGNKYEVDDNIVELWKSCSYLTYIEKRNGRNAGKGKISNNEIINYELLDNDYLFKAIRGKKENDDMSMKIGAFNNIILKVFDKYSNSIDKKFRVSPLNIQLSGMFYKLHVLETSGTEVTPEIIAKFKNIKYSNHTELLANTRNWRKDYEDWKLAFGYM